MANFSDFLKQKQQGVKLVMLTAYDYPTAVLQAQAGVDILLIGDSVGRNMLGYASEIEVTMADMLHHTRAVARGAGGKYVLGDMPYKSFDTPESALDNAKRFLDAGADGVKIEGEEWILKQVAHMADAGIEVCAHIGYTPQTDGLNAAVQGKDVERAKDLITIARQLEDAGAGMIVFELIPELLAKEITALLKIPTIGIGAGQYCDGQVQVFYDILGLSAKIFRHAKAYESLKERFENAFAAYVKEVRAGQFPTSENSSKLPDDVAQAIQDWLKQS